MSIRLRVNGLNFSISVPCGTSWAGYRHSDDVRVLMDRAMDHAEHCEECASAPGRPATPEELSCKRCEHFLSDHLDDQCGACEGPCRAQ